MGITVVVGAIRVAAQSLVEVEVVLPVSDGGPVPVAGAVVEGQPQVADAAGLEAGAPPEPPPDLPAQEVADGLGAAGVDQVAVAGVQLYVLLAVQNGIASSVGGHVITVGQVLEALLRHVSPEDGLGLLWAAGLGQGVGQSSDPGEGPRLGQVTEENRALVSSVSGNTSVLVLLSGAELCGGGGHQSEDDDGGLHVTVSLLCCSWSLAS